MGTLKALTREEAEVRFYWLRFGIASIELDKATNNALWEGAPDAIDAKVIEKLEEIARVAREVAKHYRDKQEAK